MAKGANGTLDLASFTQVTQQRQIIQSRNETFHPSKSSELGVATNRLTSLFPSSPLLEENRSADDVQDRGNLYSSPGVEGDVYKAYAAAVDPEFDGTSGYGFKNQDAYLNYAHPDNPFLEGGSFDANALTTGEAVKEGTAIHHYKGFADLQPNDLNTPSIEKEGQTEVQISKKGETHRDDLFGSTPKSYRDINGSSLGTFRADGLDVSDNLGKYFKSIAERE